MSFAGACLSDYSLIDKAVQFYHYLISCCESRYRGVPENTGEFRRIPEIYDDGVMCLPLYLQGFHELLFPPIMTSWSYLPTVFENSRAV